VCAAVRSSSAASDPTTEKLECFLDHRSLLGMLQQRAPLQEDSTALQDPRHPLVRHICKTSSMCRLMKLLQKGYMLLAQHDAAV